MGKVMYFIRRCAVWLGRVRYSSGFGVQSPTAYRFTRYVVNEHYPYYAYKSLESECPCDDRRRRKLCRLYLRMANYLQPTSWLSFGEHNALVERYVYAGCHATHFVHLHDVVEMERQQQIDVVTIEPADGAADILMHAMDRATSNTVIIIENIKRDNITRQLWDNVHRDSRVIIAFDLYYCGILFFNPIMQKQFFKINF
jgi:hypothetical protein